MDKETEAMFARRRAENDAAIAGKLDPELVALLARRDCGPAEFARVKHHIKEFVENRDRSQDGGINMVNALLNSSFFSDWLRHHKDLIIEWNAKKT